MNPFVGLDSMDVVKQKEFSFRWTNLTPFLCVFRTFSRQNGRVIPDVCLT